MIKKIDANLKFIKSNKFKIIFYITIFLHLALSIHFIKNIYQECDSAGVYYLIKNFPQSVRDYASWSYSTSAKAEFYKNIRLNYLDYVQNISLPDPIQSALALAWGSTYSPGVGFLYGFLWNKNIGFSSFIHNAILLNIMIVHICALLIYKIFKNFDYKSSVYFSTPLIFLFSSSIYSYQYHLGSTIWNICSGIIFLYFYSKNYGHNEKKSNKTLAIVGSILLFFSYLSVLYWITYILQRSHKIITADERIKKISMLFKDNITYILSLVIIIVLFYQPDQGVRGRLSDGNIGDGLYYLLLNFLSIYNESPALNFIQFSFILITLVIGLLTAFIIIKKNADNLKAINSFAITFFFVFFLFLVSKKLAIAPSRHILFLLPILYVYVSNTINLIKFQSKISIFVYFALIIVGIFSNVIRSEQLKDNSLNLSKIENIKKYSSVLINDCSLSLINSKFLVGASIKSINSSYHLESGKHLYLSDTKDLDRNDLKLNNIDNDIDNAYINKLFKINSNKTFLPFSPYNYAHDRPNNFYAYELIVIK